MKIPTKISALALATTLSVTAIPAANAQLAGLSTSRSTNLQEATYKQAEVPCAQAKEVQVETGAVFSDPLQNRAGAVAERLCSYFKQADTGSTISLAAFVISGASGEDYVNELLAAYQRGVNVQVVIDGWQISSAPAARLIDALGTDVKQSHGSPYASTNPLKEILHRAKAPKGCTTSSPCSPPFQMSETS